MIVPWILFIILGLTILFGIKADDYDLECFRIFLGVLLILQSIVFIVLNITNII